MERGYIKVWRKILDSQVFKNPNLLKVWLWCLLRADHKGNWVTVKTGRSSSEVWVGPGQFIYGRDSAAKKLSMKPSSLRNRIKKLENLQNLTCKTDRQYSIITICNWEEFQANEKGKGQQNRTTVGQPQDTDKHSKHSKKKTFSQNSNEFRLSKILLEKILERKNNFKKPDIRKWAIHVDRMIRLDQRDPQEIEKVIFWCQQDQFWQNNILSTEKLRKQFDQLALKMNGDGITPAGHRPSRKRILN